MAALTILSIKPGANDLLHVTAQIGSEQVRTGTDDDGTPIFEERPTVVTAIGWVSATTNHFAPDSIGKDGHRKPDAKPRAMTDDERSAYARRLIIEQHPELGLAE
jgi:hypothetical protein